MGQKDRKKDELILFISRKSFKAQKDKYQLETPFSVCRNCFTIFTNSKGFSACTKCPVSFRTVISASGKNARILFASCSLWNKNIIIEVHFSATFLVFKNLYSVCSSLNSLRWQSVVQRMKCVMFTVCGAENEMCLQYVMQGMKCVVFTENEMCPVYSIEWNVSCLQYRMKCVMFTGNEMCPVYSMWCREWVVSCSQTLSLSAVKPNKSDQQASTATQLICLGHTTHCRFLQAANWTHDSSSMHHL